jgi:putative phosphoribosyl transferase
MGTRSIPAGQQTLSVPISSGQLDADLYWPEKAWGLVLFAHGSGSNRHSPRNRKAAKLFFQAGLASCLLDLLFIDEQASDSGMLIGLNQFAQRFAEATQWIESVLGAELPLGFYGASTGAAVALMASLAGHNPVRAIVCRGGRPDLVGQSLRLVQTPTLFLVGSRDPQVLLWNQEALEALPARTPRQLDVIAGAGHLFEGLGELEAVTERSLNWYRRYLKNEPD